MHVYVSCSKINTYRYRETLCIIMLNSNFESKKSFEIKSYKF